MESRKLKQSAEAQDEVILQKADIHFTSMSYKSYLQNYKSGDFFSFD